MPSRLFFNGKPKDTIVVDREESRHAKALRLKEGEDIELFDGKGIVYSGKIIKIGKTTEIKVLETAKFDREKPEIELWTAIPKGERADWLIEKATETGVDKIIPIIFKRSIVIPGKNKIERWKKIAITASGQSKRAYVPEIFKPISFDEALRKIGGQIIICHQNGKKINEIKLSDKIILMIGPEGGFSEEETKTIKNYEKIALGKNILRIETAGIVGISLIKNR